jgi:hypothetical protein
MLLIMAVFPNWVYTTEKNVLRFPAESRIFLLVIVSRASYLMRAGGKTAGQ